MEDPVVPFERNLYDSSLAGLFMGKTILENPIIVRLGKISNWEYSFVHRRKGIFLFVYKDDIILT